MSAAHFPQHTPTHPTNENLSSFVFFVFIVLKTCLILGSGENLSFVLYYELLHSGRQHSRASVQTHTQWLKIEDGGW